MRAASIVFHASAGIISARNNWDRRGAVRAAWADASQVTPTQRCSRAPACLYRITQRQSAARDHCRLRPALPDACFGSVSHTRSRSSQKLGTLIKQGLRHQTTLATADRTPLSRSAQVPGRSATRFFVASAGPVDPPAAAELKAHADFVWLDAPKAQSYRTIGDSTLKVLWTTLCIWWDTGPILTLLAGMPAGGCTLACEGVTQALAVPLLKFHVPHGHRCSSTWWPPTTSPLC